MRVTQHAHAQQAQQAIASAESKATVDADEYFAQQQKRMDAEEAAASAAVREFKLPGPRYASVGMKSFDDEDEDAAVGYGDVGYSLSGGRDAPPEPKGSRSGTRSVLEELDAFVEEGEDGVDDGVSSDDDELLAAVDVDEEGDPDEDVEAALHQELGAWSSMCVCVGVGVGVGVWVWHVCVCVCVACVACVCGVCRVCVFVACMCVISPVEREALWWLPLHVCVWFSVFVVSHTPALCLCCPPPPLQRHPRHVWHSTNGRWMSTTLPTMRRWPRPVPRCTTPWQSPRTKTPTPTTTTKTTRFRPSPCPSTTQTQTTPTEAEAEAEAAVPAPVVVVAQVPAPVPVPGLVCRWRRPRHPMAPTGVAVVLSLWSR